MLTRKIDLRSIAEISAVDLIKVILSSADYYPGLWRKSPVWDQIQNEDRYLKWLSFLKLLALNEKGECWTKQEWAAAQEHVNQLAYGKGSRGDLSLPESALLRESRVFLKTQSQNRFREAASLSLLCLDVDTPLESIAVGESYFVMGSVLRFEKNQVRVGYDYVRDKAVLDLPCDFSEVKSFVESIFTEKKFSDLFMRAEVIAHLRFSDSGLDAEGGLELRSLRETDAMMNIFSFASPILAAVDHALDVPIRFAQPMAVSDVTRSL